MRIRNLGLMLCMAYACVTTLTQAGAIRISFLQDAESMADTADVLKTNGFSRASVEAFQRAAAHYYAESFHLDMAKFPQAVKGFFTFGSVNDFLSALPIAELQNLDHAEGINCFDTVACLTVGRVQCALEITDEQRYGIKHRTAEGSVAITYAASVKEAVAAVYPAWYRQKLERMTGRDWLHSQEAVSLVLRPLVSLPYDTTAENVRTNALAALREHWTRNHVQVGKGVQLVLLLNAVPARQFMDGVHAGILVSRPAGFTYVEKNGPHGPFLRLDFDSIADLQDYCAAATRSIRSRHRVFSFMTLNDDQILDLKPQQRP